MLIVSTLLLGFTIVVHWANDLNLTDIETGSYIYALLAMPALIYSAYTLMNRNSRMNKSLN